MITGTDGGGYTGADDGDHDGPVDVSEEDDGGVHSSAPGRRCTPHGYGGQGRPDLEVRASEEWNGTVEEDASAPPWLRGQRMVVASRSGQAAPSPAGWPPTAEAPTAPSAWSHTHNTHKERESVVAKPRTRVDAKKEKEKSRPVSALVAR